MTLIDNQVFAAILGDRTSGSLMLAASSLHAVRRALRENRKEHARRFLQDLRNTFPGMAAILCICDELLGDLGVGTADRLLAALNDSSWLERALHTLDVKLDRIVTISNSGAVRALLCEARDRVGSVLCLRSLPGGEGADTCERLRECALNVTLIEDDAATALLRPNDVCLIGADMVCDDYVVNKLGSLALTRACRETGARVYVAAGPMKRLDKRLAMQYRLSELLERVPRDWVEILE